MHKQLRAFLADGCKDAPCADAAASSEAASDVPQGMLPMQPIEKIEPVAATLSKALQQQLRKNRCVEQTVAGSAVLVH
jgi:hypothetical protein